MVDDRTNPFNTGKKETVQRQRRNIDDLKRALSIIQKSGHDFDRYFFESLGLRYDKYLDAGGASLISLAKKADRTPVALKISLNSLQDEAENMDLVHKNGGTVPCVEAFGDYSPVVPNEVFSYLQMEYIPGQNLVPGQIDLETVLRIGIDIAKTLSIAHRHGINHNDVKPGNILYSNGKAYLIDWGSAVLRDTKSTTNQKNVLVTLSYTAPERLIDSDAEEQLGFSDQYSLGAALYAYLTGRRPYGSVQDPRDPEEVAQYMKKVRAQDRPRLVEQEEPDHTQRKRLEALDDVVSKMLQPEPLKRYGSCLEVAYVLSHI